MMTSGRPRGDVGGSFASRRGHASQISISDSSHHVTEAIGTLYGDEDDSGSESGRPLSFIGGSSYQEHLQFPPQNRDEQFLDPRRALIRSASEQPQISAPYNGEHGSLKKAHTLPVPPLSQRSSSYDSMQNSPRSPTISLRDMQQADSGQQFSLTNIDNPTDIAQELSNLQALRRMSMDVGNIKDPDIPPMSLTAIPAIAPSGDDDENDPSRLLWVPARVHPELAPTEFQSFLEKRVQSIKRRSGESSLGFDLSRTNSGSSLGAGSLRRTASKLSRQIDNTGGDGASGYVDGAERLGRQQSRRQSHELSLDELVRDPTAAVRKLAEESQGHIEGVESNPDDMPILQMAPGMGLRRSKHTTYRKGGSLRSGDKVSVLGRRAHRHQNSENSEPVPPLPMEAPPGHAITRVQSEPVSDNFSRPSRSARRQGGFAQESQSTLAALEGSAPPPTAEEESQRALQHRPAPEQLPVRSASTTSSTTHDNTQEHSDNLSSRKNELTSEAPVEPPPRSSRRAASQSTTSGQAQYTSKQPPPGSTHTLDEALSGSSTRTDALTFIPTLSQQEDRKNERKPESPSTKSSAWKWLRGGDDKKEKKDDGKKSKAKALVERAQDNVRLDVIQTSIDKSSTRGRESLVLERDNTDNKLHEERKKESNRRSDSKKDKDGSIFSSFFGGNKKKDERERQSKKSQHLRVPSETPVIKPLEPDVDYHWTRFPLLEERAIYRMAHIKLANPRRPLLSQVLLSNFMYSYLAIVQAMHPQMNVPVSPQQKRLEEEARRKKQEEDYLAQQRAMQEAGEDPSALDQYDFDYHRAAVQYADGGHNGQVDYVDDAQIYEDEHGTDQHHQNHQQRQQYHQQEEYDDDYGYDGSESYGQDDKDYYQYQHDNNDQRRRDGRDGRDDMW